MSKRQRRRVNERRSVHMQRRTVLPLAMAAVAAPAVAAPAAQAVPHVRFDGSVLNGVAFHHTTRDSFARLSERSTSLSGRTSAVDDAIAGAETGMRRQNTSAAKALTNATQTGLFRARPGRPRRPVAPVPLSPTVMAPAPTPVEIQLPAAPAATAAPGSGTTAPATASTPAPAATAPAAPPATAPAAPTIPGAPADALAGSAIAPTPAPATPAGTATPATPDAAATPATPDATATPTTPDVAIGVPVTPGGPEAGSAIAPVGTPATPDATAAPAPVPVATPNPADAGAAIAPAPAPAPTPADAGAALAPALTPPTAPATQDGIGPPTPPANPDAPPQAPNPTPTTGTGGVSVGASYYDGVGGGATLVVTPTGTYIVPEFGIGFGPSVSANAGSNVNVPNAPQLQLGFTGGDQIGDIGYRGSGSVTVPLNDPSLNNTNVGGNFGFNVPGSPSLQNFPGTNVPLTNLRVSGNYSPAAGLTGGFQYSGTNQLFDVGDQVKLAVRVPIPLPNLTQTTPPDSNGVSELITPTGEGPPSIIATRDVSNLGYPDGQGDTVTLNPDGSYTLHTPTSDVTNFGPYYQQQNGLDSSQGGSLTHQLIDTMGQQTDQWTWKGNDGTTVTQSPSGTLTQTNPNGTTIQQSSSGVVTQTNSDGSTVSYDPSSGNITSSDGHWFGATTTFYPDGSVSQTSPAGTTMWDSSGSGTTIPNSLDGPGFPMSTSEPAPTAPSIPNGISLPHSPNAPATNNQSSNTDNSNTDNTNTDASNATPAPAPAPAPTDSTPAPAPTDSTPTPAPAPHPRDTHTRARANRQHTDTGPRAGSSPGGHDAGTRADRHDSRADRHHPGAHRHHPDRSDRHHPDRTHRHHPDRTHRHHPNRTHRHHPRPDRHHANRHGLTRRQQQLTRRQQQPRLRVPRLRRPRQRRIRRWRRRWR